MKIKQRPWSNSRIDTFRSCALKYYYSYVQKWEPSIPANTEAADKGSCFHETVEIFKTGMPHDQVYTKLQEKIEEYKVDVTKYDEKAAVDRFFLFWNEFVAKKELAGYKVIPEFNCLDTIEGEPFTGYIDLLLDNGEDVIIYDYKSAKSTSTTRYKGQLILYAYMIGHVRGWTNKEIAERCKLYIFFPFSEQEKPITEHDKMLASVKQIKITEKDVNEIMAGFSSTIKEIKAMDWTKIDPNFLGKVEFACKWCPFLGSIDNGEGFRGCGASYRAGFFQNRNLKFTLKYDKTKG